MGKVYRSAQGREIDMEKIRLQNELVPALGNMKVNARGDQLGPGGKILKTREQIVDEQYRGRLDTTTKQAKEGPIPTRMPRPKDQPIPTSSKKVDPFSPGEIIADAAPVQEEPVKVPKPRKSKAEGGLAKAVAKAKEE